MPATEDSDTSFTEISMEKDTGQVHLIAETENTVFLNESLPESEESEKQVKEA